MPQPWEMDWSQGQKPASGPIMGAPVDPSKRAGEARAQSAEQRAREDQAFQREKFANDQVLQRRRLEMDEEKTAREKGGAGAVESERKAAAFLIRALGSNSSYEKQKVGPRSYVGQKLANSAPDFLNTLPEAVGNSPARQVADTNQDEFIAASLRQDSGAAIPEQEMERQRRIYFPMPGDSDEAIKAKREARIRAIEGLKQSAGRLEPSAQQRYDALGGGGDQVSPSASGKVNIPTIKGGLPEGTQVQFGMDKWGEFDKPFDRTDYIQRRYGITSDQEDWIVAFWNGNRQNPGLTLDGVKQAYTEAGIPLPTDADIQKGISDAQPGFEFSALPTAEAEQEYRDRLNKLNTEAGGLTGAASQDRTSAAGYTNRVYTGASMSLGDEMRGLDAAGYAVWAGRNPLAAYAVNRDAERQLQEQSRNEQGLLGWVAEIGGSIPTALLAPGALSRNIWQAAKAGAIVGAVQGFGQGEGLAGSTVNALVGASIGGVTGGAGQGGLNKLAAYARAPKPGISNADEVAQAGVKEGVDVNRAMVDPALQNRVTGVDASMAGGPKFQRGMSNIEGQIEGRVSDLGQGGTPLNRMAQGQLAQGAGERFIKNSGKSFRDQYDIAEKMAGSAKVEPKTSLNLTDDTIARLSETPETNIDEIAFLKKIKSDLSKDLSVGGLRRMRTSLRKKISKGDLVFGEDEATVLGIMDAAADDIASGLQKQGLGKAAEAFKRVDAGYRERMEYIKDTLQKIVGKRGSSLSAERVADNLTAMARGKDQIGVKKFLDTLDPEERIDTAATFAEVLGKNGKENFTVDTFLRQTSEKNFPQGALRVVFGEEGAASIGRLRVLSKEVTRVTGAMNSRKSGTAVGNDYRSWLFNTVLGTAPGAASGNMTTAIAGAGLTLGAKAGRDIISARALLSKDITKWLAQAPRTTNPKAINEHLSQLSVVAGSQSAYRMDAQQIANYLRDAITSKSTTAAAAGEQEQN